MQFSLQLLWSSSPSDGVQLALCATTLCCEQRQQRGHGASLQAGRRGQVGSLEQSDPLSRGPGWEQQQEMCGHGHLE